MLAVLFVCVQIPLTEAAITKTKKENIFSTEKSIAINAQLLAHKILANNKNDEKGLMLLQLANHLYPKYEPLLLLRGK